MIQIFQAPVPILQEPVGVSGSFKFGVTLLQHLCQDFPDFSQSVDSLLNDHGLFRMGLGNLLRLLLKSVELCLNGSQVPLHSWQLPLKCPNSG